MQTFNQSAPAAPYRNAQIIVLGLVMGLAVFAVITFLTPPRQVGSNVSGVQMMRMLAIVGIIVAIPIAVLIRKAMLRPKSSTGKEVNPYRSTPDENRLPADTQDLATRFTSATIVGCVLIEGPSIFLIVVCLSTGVQSDLLALVLPLSVMLFGFMPTEARWRSFAG